MAILGFLFMARFEEKALVVVNKNSAHSLINFAQLVMKLFCVNYSINYVIAGFIKYLVEMHLLEIFKLDINV